MPDEDARIYGEAYGIYSKYRWTEMKTEEQWMALADECRYFAEKHNWRENPLAYRLALAVLDTLGDMYKDGRKPKIPDYFGRDDL